MSINVTRSVLDALSVAVGIPIHPLPVVDTEVRRIAADAVNRTPDDVARIATDGGRYLACRYHASASAIVILGPFRREGDSDAGAEAARTVSTDEEARLTQALSAAATAIGQVEDERLQRLELASQLEVTSRSVLAVTGELELSTVLRRIVDLAREIAGARYAALGVPNDRGEMEQFITSGMSDEDEARIPHRPRGLGLLGLLLNEPKTIRLANLAQHPNSAGFPANHPPMTSFLGVPIIARGRNLGNLYLTEKRFSKEFTDNDARLVELLARHAAVAIENAYLYNEIEFQQQRLKIILDQLPEAIIFVEPDPDRVTIANQHAFDLLGWTEALPMPLEEFFNRNTRYTPDGERVPTSRLAATESLRSGAIINRREVRIERPDGKRITVLVNSAPLVDEYDRVTAAISVFQDITQIKDAEQLKDDFLSLVSHELRTPLTTIQGGSMLLLNGGVQLDEDTRQEILSDMAGETRRLGKLIENMVQLANIRAGRMVLESDIVHVRRAIDRAVQSEQQAVPGREFVIDAPPDLFAVGDPSLLDQLLRNLIHNAVKYAPGSSPIEVTARRDGGREPMVEISVRDHGPGIQDTDVPLVFDRFHRNREAVESGTPGMGLGLYLARNLVEAHGGRIWIERPDDGGTRIVFTVPAEDFDEDE